MSENMFFEAAKKRIFEWIEYSKADIDCDFENGWDEDSVYDEIYCSHEELVEEIRKLEFFLDDSDSVEDLVFFAEEALENLEEYIYRDMELEA